MVFSLSAVLIPVVVILAITWRNHDQYAPQVDYAGAVAQALTAGPFAIQVPRELPAGYSVSAAALENETYGNSGDFRWRISLISSNNKFMSLWQTTGPENEILTVTTNAGTCEGSQEIAGSTWTKCDNGNPVSRAYFIKTGNVLTVVYGTVSFDELASFIESLELQIS
jgi:hypothetical protein